MMPYYTRNDDEVDYFDDYDPTPYGGGYDLALTYGGQIPPSGQTCYPLTSPTDDTFEYERPEFSSYHEPSAYADEALKTEYSSYARPKPRPGPTTEPDYGGSEFGSEYGSGGIGRKLEDEEPGSEYEPNEEGGYTKPSYCRDYDEEGGCDDEEGGYGGMNCGDDDDESYGGKKYCDDEEEGYDPEYGNDESVETGKYRQEEDK